MYEEKTDNKGLSFYGTFVLIYTVLNIAAFVILLLTTEWSVLADDEGDGFWAGFWFMVIGIAAALIHGIGPALMFKRRGNTSQIEMKETLQQTASIFVLYKGQLFLFLC